MNKHSFFLWVLAMLVPGVSLACKEALYSGYCYHPSVSTVPNDGIRDMTIVTALQGAGNIFRSGTDLSTNKKSIWGFGYTGHCNSKLTGETGVGIYMSGQKKSQAAGLFALGETLSLSALKVILALSNVLTQNILEEELLSKASVIIFHPEKLKKEASKMIPVILSRHFERAKETCGLQDYTIKTLLYSIVENESENESEEETLIESLCKPIVKEFELVLAQESYYQTAEDGHKHHSFFE